MGGSKRVVQLKRVIILTLALIIMGTTTLQSVGIPFTTGVASAQENASKEDGGNKDEVTADIEKDLSNMGKENVFNGIGSDATKRGRILGSVKYNEQMQFLMTYTILKGKYMNSKYSSIYTSGEFEKDAKSGTNIDIVSGYSNIVLDAGEDKDSTHEGKTESEKEEEDKKQKNKEKVYNALIDSLTDKYTELYIRKYYISPDEMTGGGKELIFEMKDKATPSNKTVNKYVAQFKKDKSRYNDIYKTIRKIVELDVNANKTTNLISNKDIMDVDIAKTYMKNLGNYKLKKLNLSWQGLGDKLIVEKIGSETPDELKARMRFNPNVRTSWKSILYSNNTWNYTEEFNPEFKKWKKKTEKWLKNSEEYKAYEKLAKKSTSDVDDGKNQVGDENVVGLGFIPLKIKVNDKLKGDKKYVEMIKEFDGGEIKDGNKVTITKKDGTVVGERPLQLNDLFNMPVKKDEKRSTSASPYLSYNYLENFNKNMSGAYLGNSDIELGDNIGKYSSVKMEKVSNNVLEWITAKFGKNTGKGIADALTLSDIKGAGDKLYPHKGISAVGTNIKKIDGVEKKNHYVLGIDNYGNIISTQTLEVVIPYWMNTEVKEFKGFNTKDAFFYSTPLMNGEMTSDVVGALNSGSSSGIVKESNADISGLTFVTDKTPYQKFLATVSTSGGDVERFAMSMRGDGGSPEDARINTQALAMAIVASTKKEVKQFNTTFVKVADEESELYLQGSDVGFEMVTKSDEDLLNEYTNKDLLDRIMMILDVGFFELIRLTVASWVVSFYTSTVMNFSMSSVFHTSLITDTAMWGEVVRSISFLLIGFVGVYILFLSLRLFRRTMSIGQFIKQFLAVTLVLVIPTVVYSPLIHMTINAPTQKVVGTQMEQMSMLDAYMNREAERREQDPLYSKLFGSVSDLRDRTEDYVVELFTTQHVDGFDVTNVNYDDLSYKNQFRSISSSQSGKWRKSDLIKVKVSIFDMFEWVESEEDMPLFKWLATEYPEKYGEVANYEEFKTSTAVSYPELGVSEEGEVWKASDLYKKMYRDTNDAEVIKNISSLYSITEAFRNRGNNKESMKITDYEREALVRDLAMTADSRESLYGDGRQMSQQATDLINKYGGEKMVSADGEAVAPEDDFLALANIVNKLVPYRDMTTTTLDRDVYNINKKVIDEYISNYSIVRETVGDKSGYKEAEFHMIVMNMWFSVNDILDLPMFPRTYDVASISFDSYMRLVFIPMDSFANIEDKDLENVSQYISLREHPMTLLLGFLPALIMLMVFGMIYIAVFFVLMMLVLTASFIWNYVIKNNTDNKSWLGAIMIIGSFALVKLGLLLLWKAMAYVLNYSFIIRDGLSYPYVGLHSLVIAIYIFFAIKLVFLRVFKAIWTDKSNLGGEVFSQGVTKMVDSVRGKLTGQSRTGEDGSKGAGSSVSKELNNEGEEGKIKSLAGGFSIGALKQLVSDKMGYIDETHEDVLAIEEALKATGELGEGREFADRFKQIVPGVSGKMVEGLAEDYDSIVDEGLGLTKEEQESLESSGNFGSVISTTADGSNITTMDAVTEENAELIKNELTKKGIKAVVDGNNVMFNSQGLNLESEEVRKGLFGGAVKGLLAKTAKLSKPEIEEIKDVKDYEMLENGEVSIGIGSTGIDTESLNAVLDSKAFRNSFDVVEMPVIKDGKYLQGQMKVIPKNSGVDVEETMESLYKVDSTVRSIKGVDERSDLNLTKGFKLSKEEQVDSNIVNRLESGMRIQEGKLLYDDKNESHVKAVNDITKEVSRGRDGVHKDKADIMMRLMSQVADGGSNGFRTETVNTGTNAEAKAYAQAMGLVDEKVETKVFAGKKAKEVSKRIGDMRNLINASHKSIETYMSTRDELYQTGEQIMLGKDNSPEKVLNTMAKYAKNNDVEEKKVNSIMSEYGKLGDKRKNSEIKESEYHREVEKLMADMQITIQDAGKYDQLMTETIRKDSEKGKKGKGKEEKVARNTELLDSFTESKKNLKGQGVDVATMEKYQESDLDTIGQLIGDIESINTNEDGTLSINSYSKLDNADMVNLFGSFVNDNGGVKKEKVPRENINTRKEKAEKAKKEQENKRKKD